MNALEIPPLVVHGRPAAQLPRLTTSDEVTRLYVDETTQDIVLLAEDGSVAFFPSCHTAVNQGTRETNTVAQPLLHFRPAQQQDITSGIVALAPPRLARRHPTPLLYTHSTASSTSYPSPVYYLVALSCDRCGVDLYHVPACDTAAAYNTDPSPTEGSVGCLVLQCVGRYRCTPPGLRFCTGECHPVHTFFWSTREDAAQGNTPAEEARNVTAATHVLLCVTAVSIDVLSVTLTDNTSDRTAPQAQFALYQQYITHTDAWCYEPRRAMLLSVNLRKPHLVKPFCLTYLSCNTFSTGVHGRANVIQPLRKLVLQASEAEALSRVCRDHEAAEGHDDLATSSEKYAGNMAVSAVSQVLGLVILYRTLYLYHMTHFGTHVMLYQYTEDSNNTNICHTSGQAMGFSPALLLAWGTGIDVCQPRCVQVVDNVLLIHHMADRVTTVYDTAMARDAAEDEHSTEGGPVVDRCVQDTAHSASYTQGSAANSASSLSSSSRAMLSAARTQPLTRRGWLSALLPDASSATRTHMVSNNSSSSASATSHVASKACRATSELDVPQLTPLLIAPLSLYTVLHHSDTTSPHDDTHTRTINDVSFYDDCRFTSATGQGRALLLPYSLPAPCVYEVGINPFVLAASGALARHSLGLTPLARFFLRRAYYAGNVLPRLLRVLLHGACVDQADKRRRATAWAQWLQVIDVCLTAYTQGTCDTAQCETHAQLSLCLSADVWQDRATLWQVMCASPQGCLSLVHLCSYVFRYVYEELRQMSTCAVTKNRDEDDDEEQNVCTSVQDGWRVLWDAVLYFARQVTLALPGDELQLVHHEQSLSVVQETMTDILFAAAAAHAMQDDTHDTEGVQWLVRQLRDVLHILPWYAPQLSLVRRLLTLVPQENSCSVHECRTMLVTLATQLLNITLVQAAQCGASHVHLSAATNDGDDDDSVLDLWLQYASGENVHVFVHDMAAYAEVCEAHEAQHIVQVTQKLMQRARTARVTAGNDMRHEHAARVYAWLVKAVQSSSMGVHDEAEVR